MITDKPTISREVQAMADAISIIANDDLLMAANSLTVELFATCFVWTYRDIKKNFVLKVSLESRSNLLNFLFALNPYRYEHLNIFPKPQ